MRLVVVSDLHVDTSTLGVSRFDEIRAAIDASVTYAVEYQADAWMCLGDVADPDGNGATLRAAELSIDVASKLVHHRIRSIWIAGNHCCAEDGSGATVLSPLSAFARSDLTLGLVHVAESPLVVELRRDIGVLCLPFMPVSHAVDMGEAARSLWPASPKVIVAAHLTIPGVVSGEETKEMARGRDVLFPFRQTTRATVRLNGHYHKRQMHDPGDGGPPILIPGSLARLHFPGDHTPSFLVVDV